VELKEVQQKLATATTTIDELTQQMRTAKESQMPPHQTIPLAHRDLMSTPQPAVSPVDRDYLGQMRDERQRHVSYLIIIVRNRFGRGNIVGNDAEFQYLDDPSDLFVGTH